MKLVERSTDRVPIVLQHCRNITNQNARMSYDIAG